MKKSITILAILAMLISLFAVPVTVFAANESDPYSVQLYAGKNNDIGEVRVWNNASTLFIQFFIDEDDWEITETHVSVTQDVAGIPIASSSKNPVPGQFEFSNGHDPAVTEFTLAINRAELEGINDFSNIVIAAHAAVQHWGTEQVEVTKSVTEPYTPDIDWSRSTEDSVVSTPGYGGTWSYADVMSNFFDNDPMDADPWDNGVYDTINNNNIAVNYASWLYKYTDPDGGSYAGNSDLRLFRAEFDIPEGYVVNNAVLGEDEYLDRIPINDNVYVYVNGEYLFWGGTRADVVGSHNGAPGIKAIGYNSGEQLETDGWYIPGTFPTIENLIAGQNTIEVFTEENERWGGMGKLGLTLCVTHDVTTTECRDVIDKCDSAWAATAPGVFRINSSPKGNWGTYFDYSLDGWSE